MMVYIAIFSALVIVAGVFILAHDIYQDASSGWTDDD